MHYFSDNVDPQSDESHYSDFSTIWGAVSRSIVKKMLKENGGTEGEHCAL